MYVTFDFIFTSCQPNVVLFLGITTPPQPITIVTEYCANGSLYTLIHSGAEIGEMLQKKILLGVARGMLHLHSENIIHRDLAVGSFFRIVH